MKMESLNTSLPWTLQPNKSMMMQSLGPSLTLIEGILNEDGESQYESPLDTSAKQKYDDAVLGTITHPHLRAYSMKMEGLNKSLSWTLQPNTSMMESQDFSPS